VGVTPVAADQACMISGQVVTCALGTLAPGAQVGVHVSARVDRVGTFVNTATASSASVDPTPDDARALARLVVATALPPTGSNPVPALLAAAAVLAAGASIVWLRRRRQVLDG
jgi:LPXTG-motif cell wall-anchored protein